MYSLWSRLKSLQISCKSHAFNMVLNFMTVRLACFSPIIISALLSNTQLKSPQYHLPIHLLSHQQGFQKWKFLFCCVWSISIYYGKNFTIHVYLYHKNPLRFILHLNATRQTFFKQNYLSSTMGCVCAQKYNSPPPRFLFTSLTITS